MLHNKIVGRAMKVIGENTGVSISVIIVMFGGIAWLTTMNNQVSANTQTLSKMESREERIYKFMKRMDKRMYRMEAKAGLDPLPVEPDEQ